MKIKLQFLLITILFITGSYSSQEESLYKPINSFLSKYRHNINKEDISVQNGIISITLQGRRTNLQSLLLLGFYTIGRVLDNRNTDVRIVQVVIKYDHKGGQEIIMSQRINRVLDLSKSRINPEQFFNDARY